MLALPAPLPPLRVARRFSLSPRRAQSCRLPWARTQALRFQVAKWVLVFLGNLTAHTIYAPPHSSTVLGEGRGEIGEMPLEQDDHISEVFEREQSRLRNFIRRRVLDRSDAEDILQDVFYKLVEANRMLVPIDHVTGWLFRVARNRIVDLFRRKRPESFSDTTVADEDDGLLRLEDLLPSPDAGPEALYARSVLLDELELAVEELPEEQREVFVAHELEGRSFKEMAAETGVNVNTLLSRKRYAVLYLRERLQSIYDEFT